MKTDDLKEMNALDRITMLQDSCDRAEQFSYTKEFTPEQLATFKDVHAELSMEVADKEEALKEETRVAREQIKQLKADAKKILTGLRYKSEQVTEQVFLFANHETGMMEYVNDSGDVVHTRRLMADERQLRIKVMKEGTND